MFFFLFAACIAGKLEKRASSGFNFVDPLIGTANGGLSVGKAVTLNKEIA